MMVEGRHLENALLAQLVAAHLQNHGDRFDDEDSADEKQQHFLLMMTATVPMAPPAPANQHLP